MTSVLMVLSAADPWTLTDGTKHPTGFWAEEFVDRLAPVLASPANLSDVDPDSFDLVVYPGGHGPMEDLAYDKTSGALLANRLASGKPLSNREELLNRFAQKAPWLLEDKLKETGAEYSKGRLPLRPYTVIDRNLCTGQNQQSSEKLASRLVEDLR
jgi:putative intracellular protease/amidase